MSNEAEVQEDDEDEYYKENFILCPICNEKCYWYSSDCDHLILGSFCGDITYFHNKEICDLIENITSEVLEIRDHELSLFTIMDDLSESFQVVEFFCNHEVNCLYYFSDRQNLPEILVNYKNRILKELNEEDIEDEEES